MKNHSTSRAEARDQPPLVKVSQTTFVGATNTRCDERDFFRRLNPELSFASFNEPDDILTVYFGPGQGLGRAFRRDVEHLACTIGNPHNFPSRIEIEFSSSPRDLFPAADGLPEDYLQSAVQWALSLSSAAVLCVSDANGTVREPLYFASAIQTVFRCAPSQTEAWTDYLRRRLTPRQKLAVVQLAACGVRS